MSGDDRPDVAVFVAREGNRFMLDIAEMLVEAAQTEYPARLVDDRLPMPDGAINLVVAPHEFFELYDASTRELQRAAAASVCVGTEQPGTPWFRLTADVARRGLRTLDINRVAVAALRDEGIDTRHLQMGAVDSLAAASVDRDIDVLFLGSLDDRRGEVLASLAPLLYERRSELRLFRFDRPVGADTPGLVFGAQKAALLARARVLINVHRDGADDGPAYFEWVRMVEAMANGCAVLTEPSDAHDPLEAGTHFVEASRDAFGGELIELLDDEPRRAAVAEAGRRAVTEQLAFGPSVVAHLRDIEHEVLPHVAAHVADRTYLRGRWTLHGETQRPVKRLGPMMPFRELQRSAKRLALAEGAALRRIDELRSVIAHGTEMHIERIESPAYAAAVPDVSVIVTLYNYADLVGETLESIATNTGVDFEIIVIDDHSTDSGRHVVASFIDAHPELPILLIGKDANEGLARARNTGFSAARAPYVMVVDADNHLYPTALARLRKSLEQRPDASATYSILEVFGDERTVLSAIDWDPERLLRANYIDAQAMWRASDWWDLGGYRPDEGIHGWEDWDLWLRLAASGGTAVIHREMLGRYRVRAGSMVSLTNLAADDARAEIRARYPALPWPNEQ
ncbi:MAG: glycosyltransferase [Ilumatobacteraceae bacterium]|nr:glycosyltransferase [Ilumatobacteraceae bacterium]